MSLGGGSAGPLAFNLEERDDALAKAVLNAAQLLTRSSRADADTCCRDRCRRTAQAGRALLLLVSILAAAWQLTRFAAQEGSGSESKGKALESMLLGASDARLMVLPLVRGRSAPGFADTAPSQPTYRLCHPDISQWSPRHQPSVRALEMRTPPRPL